MNLTDTEIEKQLKACVPAELDSSLLAKLENAMEHCQDSHELRSIEADLALLEPESLSEDQIEALESAMELSKIESYLEGFAAESMGGELLQRMESAMDNWQSNETDNVVDFTPAAVAPKATKRSYGMVWSSAAAVAILFGSGYLLKDQSAAEVKDLSAKAKPTATVVDEVPFEASEAVPENMLSSNIKNASYEGTVNSKSIAHKVLRVQYEDVIEYTDEKGRKCKVKKPRFKYVLVPVEVN